MNNTDLWSRAVQISVVMVIDWFIKKGLQHTKCCNNNACIQYARALRHHEIVTAFMNQISVKREPKHSLGTMYKNWYWTTSDFNENNGHGLVQATILGKHASGKTKWYCGSSMFHTVHYFTRTWAHLPKRWQWELIHRSSYPISISNTTSVCLSVCLSDQHHTSRYVYVREYDTQTTCAQDGLISLLEPDNDINTHRHASVTHRSHMWHRHATVDLSQKTEQI